MVLKHQYSPFRDRIGQFRTAERSGAFLTPGSQAGACDPGVGMTGVRVDAIHLKEKGPEASTCLGGGGIFYRKQ